MKVRMPPLQGLYYFYVAADKGSFKAASEALFVTAAAVSQQIRQLEEWLNCELFHRQHRKIQLTSEGELLYGAAQRGFSELLQGVQRLKEDPEPGRLSISTQPGFAQYWLIPRIKSFRNAHPDLSLLIDVEEERVDFQEGLIDVGVHYGNGEFAGLEATWLMDEILYPVCHPSYREEHGLYELEDLVYADLIEDLLPDMSWSLWFSKLGIRKAHASLKYDGSQYVLEGALAAQGVAMLKHSMVYRQLEEGKLVRIGNKAVKSRFSYYLCMPAGYARRDKIRYFAEWLQNEVAAFKAEDREGISLLDLPDEQECIVEIDGDVWNFLR